jgi:RNA-binding protein
MSNIKQNSTTISKTLKIELRANAHHLKPVVMIGQGGVTDGVLKEIDINLQVHTLIKVRILAEDSKNNKNISSILCDKLNCHLIQGIGKLL